MRKLISPTLFLICLAACLPGPASPTVPSSTVTVQEIPSASESPTPDLSLSVTAEASPIEAPLPSETPVPDVPTLSALTPIYPSPEPSSAALQILAPGPLSRVVSPLQVRGYIIPGVNNLARLELFGEDGRLLVRQLMYLYTTKKWAYLSTELHFEVHAAGELGRLTVSTEDAYGRVQARNSVHVILLPEGYSQINPDGRGGERCLLHSPLPNGQVAGSLLVVEGEMRPYSSQQLVVELITRDGQVITSRMVGITPSPDDSYVPFTTQLPYMVEAPMWVQLSVRQSDDRITGEMYRYTQLIYISP